MLALQVILAVKSTTNVLDPFAPRQAGLRRGVVLAQTVTGIDRPAKATVQRSGDFECLVETTFTEPQWMERKRHDAVEGRRGITGKTPCFLLLFDGMRKLFAEIGAQCQAVLIFERLNELIQWKVIAECGDDRIEMWRVGETASAALPGKSGQGALRAAPLRQARQIASTVGADDFVAAGGAAQQAVLYQQAGAEISEYFVAFFPD